jgi:antitoxin MazE
MKAHLGKWGNSLAVRIPKNIAEEASLEEGDGIEVKAVGPGSIQIRTMKRKPTIAQLVRGITPGNRHSESDWGRPVGNELW